MVSQISGDKCSHPSVLDQSLIDIYICRGMNTCQLTSKEEHGLSHKLSLFHYMLVLSQAELALTLSPSALPSMTREESC